ncbi:MAG TPA: 4-hydroxyphenylacetate 3-hydroxylase N-terminal domain-containing protein [Burkholderiales bacterium]|nr:4-hydroxyphenylacetate 3-hydroxylase N-terminal domain-containing protein [Burkholderiales bacterium]
MLRSGRQYLEALRDGRVIYLADERIADVTTHPGFRNGARTYAALYDLKAQPELHEAMSYEEAGERYSMHFLRPRTREDLVRRTRAHELIADFGCGVLGRSPDAVAGSITGISMKPEILEQKGGHKDHLLKLWQQMRHEDQFVTYAVLPPQGGRDPKFYQGSGRQVPALRVTKETDAGVVLNGMKMLATGAAFADAVLVGNILPLAPDQLKESVTAIVPLNLKGLTLWARKSFEREVSHPFDYPLTARYDESDCMLVFQDVLVPWERVFVHDNPELARAVLVQTPAHVMANHQCNVRFRSKLRFLLGLASLVTHSTGARDVPVVRETLGRFAAAEAGFSAMIDAQHMACEAIDNGYVLYNRRYMYAAIHWAMENHSVLCDQIRELMGGGMFQMPASVTILDDPALKALFEEYWTTPKETALDRLKLFKLAWDMIGSEWASRALSYEKFFVGPAFSVRNYNFVNCPWERYQEAVREFMASY